MIFLTNVKNMLYYGEALSKNGVPFELHIVPKGGHCCLFLLLGKLFEKVRKMGWQHWIFRQGS